MSREKKLITYISLGICFLLVLFYCFFPFSSGINTGGGNSKVESEVGLSGINNGHFYVKYNIVSPSNISNSNTFVGIIKPIVSVAGAFTQYFDIRIISFIYLLLLLLSVFYLNKYINLGSFKNNIIFAILLIVVYFDFSYLIYLNTLYAEAAFYVFFLLSVSLYIKLIMSAKPQLPTTIVFFLISLIVCGLINNFYLLSIPYAIMTGYLFFRRKGYFYRTVVVLFTILLIIDPIIKYSGNKIEKNDSFNSVFYGALYHDNMPEESLKKLDINEKYHELAGKSNFENLPDYVQQLDFEKEFYNKISYKKLFKYYILNPDKFVSQYKFAGYNAFDTYPSYSANITMNNGEKLVPDIIKFKIANLIKIKVFPKTLWFIFLIPLLTVALLIGYRKIINNKGIITLGISVSLMSFILFIIPMINSGLADISRTMSVFNVVFDSMIVILITNFIYVTSKRKREFKDKYGLSQ